MRCNIDRHGRIARLVSGLLFLAAGASLLLAAWLGQGAWAWKLAAGVLCLAGGAFQVFEAWKGWCVTRAMGFRTPM